VTTFQDINGNYTIELSEILIILKTWMANIRKHEKRRSVYDGVFKSKLCAKIYLFEL
jgi:hypothetical protein